MTSKFLYGGLVAATALMASATVGLGPLPANAAFPEKPIKLIVGFRAGGGTDTLATALIRGMEKILGQPVVKEIRAGGGGSKAAAAAKLAAPDGYTLVMAVTPTFAFNTAAIPGKTPYTKDDFDYLETISKAQEAVYTRADAPFKTWKEMIAYARKGNKLVYAAVTPFDKLLIRYVNKKEGVNIRTIPTKGGSGALKNILGGHADIGFSGGTHVKMLGKGEIRVLASLRGEPLVNTPEVPTLMDLGYPITFEAHFLVAAPKGLPADIKKTLVDAIRTASRGEEVRKVLTRLPFPAEQLGPEKLKASIDAAYGRYLAMVKELK
jgi:tripartite-type tricarboxylate transporter receptor subunit TctC